MKIYLYVGSIAAILLGLWLFHLYSFDLGAQACERAHDKAALEAQAAALEKGTKHNIVDSKANLGATVAVEDKRKVSSKRLDRIATAPLAPGATNAASCPDVLGPEFWRLYDGEPDGPGAADPAASPASGVPGSG